MSGFRHLGDRLVHQGYIWHVAVAEFESPEGEAFTRDIVRSPGAVAAVPLRFDTDGAPRVVLVSQYRPPLDDYVIEVPAGMMVPAPRDPEGPPVKVIASSVRKGNILERDGQLCLVLTAESFHPGKGTPTTQIDMRRLSDGVKVTDRYKTTEQVERAFVEDHDYSFLYKDADGHHFMNQDNYDQVIVPEDVLGDQAIWLQEGMVCILSVFNDLPVGIQLPQRVTAEVVETEPVTKGQTASSSYKPAKLANGARVRVPPHIAAGTRIVVLTEDSTYSERAKD